MQAPGDGPVESPLVARQDLPGRADTFGHGQVAVLVRLVAEDLRTGDPAVRGTGGRVDQADRSAALVDLGARREDASMVVVRHPLKNASMPALRSRKTVVQSRQPTGPYRRR